MSLKQKMKKIIRLIIKSLFMFLLIANTIALFFYVLVLLHQIDIIPKPQFGYLFVLGFPLAFIAHPIGIYLTIKYPNPKGVRDLWGASRNLPEIFRTILYSVFAFVFVISLIKSINYGVHLIPLVFFYSSQITLISSLIEKQNLL